MKKISYSGYRFPPEIIQQAIWLYLRFTLSLRDVEDLLAERGVAVLAASPVAAMLLRRRVGPGNFTPSLSQIRTRDSRLIRLVPLNEGWRLPAKSWVPPVSR